MNESGKHPTSDEADPMLLSLNRVLETLNRQFLVPEAAGATATAAATDIAEPAQPRPPEAKHERPKPEHWDELVEFAGTLPIFERQSPGGDIYFSASVNALRKKIQESLPTGDDLDRHRYYGIGTMLCGVAQGLQNPEQRIKATDSISDRMYRNWLQEGSGPVGKFMPVDVSATGIIPEFAAMLQEFVNDLPPPVRLLNDVLYWHSLERESALRNGDTELPETLSLARNRRKANTEYRAGDAMRQATGGVTAASARVLRLIVNLRAEYLKKDRNFPDDPTAQQVINATDMDDINLVTVAMSAAAVRMDELGILEKELITLDDNGRAVFHVRKLPRAKDLQPPEHDPQSTTRLTLHDRRHRCPALFVGDLIPGVMGCLVKAVGLTDKRVRMSHMRGRTGKV